MDRSGNLYGTASGGGSGVEQVGNGTAFRYALAANKFTTLYTFSPFDNYPFNLTNSSGAQPAAGLIMDSNGNLYGTTWKGAAYGYGAIFVLHPVYYVIPPHSSQPTQGSSPPPPHGTAPTP
jgi:uncharacterized repeat protein (TIGR03803 family)